MKLKQRIRTQLIKSVLFGQRDLGGSRKRAGWIALSFILGLTMIEVKSQASVNTLPHLVTPGEFAVGVDPEFLFSNDMGPSALGVNLRYTHGISDISNLMGIVGTGGGDRQFRAGGAATFDLYPDIENQPGIGIAIQSLYVQHLMAGSVEVSVAPYVHKTFVTDKGIGMIEPFLALPIGLSFSQGVYQVQSLAALGVISTHSAHFKSVLEIGIGLNHTNTYLSGGIVYYH